MTAKYAKSDLFTQLINFYLILLSLNKVSKE